jgi:predicted acyl esterase
MISMRDGVKLHTVILVPKGAKKRADPADSHSHSESAHLGPILNSGATDSAATTIPCW